MMKTTGVILTMSIAILLGFSSRLHALMIHPPLGPHINLTEADFTLSASFSTNDLMVSTYYFYWYDIDSKAHIVNGDGTDALTDHPPSSAGFSYQLISWHKGQLLAMIDAGIDVVLPVSWGAPSERDPARSQNYWSFAGLGPLLKAREELLAEGKQPPFLGMFYDTSTLKWNSWGRHIDLTTDYGRQWFYESIRDFFSLIPPRHWAMIDGQPVVFLYVSSFARRYDQSAIDFTQQAFARDFTGRKPYLVREVSWNIRADAVYAWGGALGLKNPGIASLGPGYDDSAVPGRISQKVPREGGRFFERNWIKFLRQPSPMVVIETWNEFHEGTEIAESKEYGRQYIDLNRKYSQMFRQQLRPRPLRGPYSDVHSVQVELRRVNQEFGLGQIESADGVTASTNLAGIDCRMTVPTVHAGRYIYFRVDDSFKWAPLMSADLEVGYYDSSWGKFWVEYDGSDTNAPFQGAYTSTRSSVPLLGSRTWKTAKFNLPAARLQNSQNAGADFRIAVTASPFFVRQVKLIRRGIPAEAGQRVRGYQDDFSGAGSAHWIPLGSAGQQFQQGNGLLKVSGAASRAYLLLNLPGDPMAAQEILARVRITRLEEGSSDLGGLAAAVDTNRAARLSYHFLAEEAGRHTALFDAALGWAPRSFFQWSTNQWFWIRLRHQPNPVAGQPDLWAKTWPADGHAPEPPGWVTVWDYFPGHPIRSGVPGIVGGAAGGQMEYDFILLKRDDLPEITVQLPEFKPALSFLRASGPPDADGFSLLITGEKGPLYRLETSSDLIRWAGMTNFKMADRMIMLADRTADKIPARFYRVRIMP